jgi:hypothetical protein
MAGTPLPHFLLRQVAPGDERALALALLEAAGWSRPVLDQWASSGAVLELYDPADDQPCGAAIVDGLGRRTFALLAWAATVDTTEPGVSGRLVTAVADALRRSGAQRIVVSVGDANPERLSLLLDAGFRFATVERNAPFASGGRLGDRSRDLVWMDQDL